MREGVKGQFSFWLDTHTKRGSLPVALSFSSNGASRLLAPLSSIPGWLATRAPFCAICCSRSGAQCETAWYFELQYDRDGQYRADLDQISRSDKVSDAPGAGHRLGAEILQSGGV